MIGFYMKKNLCDGWDNVFLLAAVNILCLFALIGVFFALSAVIESEALTTAVLVLGIMFMNLLMFAFGKCAAQIAQFKAPSIKDFFLYIGETWFDAVRFSLITALLFQLGLVAIPFYLAMSSLFGVFLSALVFWLLFIATLSLQWFIPLRFLLGGDSFVKSLKKCFIIFFDNAGFSIFVFIYSIILLLLSGLLLFIVPSLSGVVLAQTNALRLRLYKYDWLEKHPELSPREARKAVPWDELIAEDRETLGPRTLKNFIFPWK